MCLLLISQSLKMCSITNSFFTKSQNIMNLAPILDLEKFTNVINKYLDHHYVIWYFQYTFLSTSSLNDLAVDGTLNTNKQTNKQIKLYEKFIISVSAIFDCKLRSSWVKSRVGPDRFEISVLKLPSIPISMLLSLI